MKNAGSKKARRRTEEERLERLIPQKAAKAVKKAYKENINSLKPGEYVLVVSNGTLYRIDHDLTRTPLRKVSPRVALPKGKKIRLV